MLGASANEIALVAFLVALVMIAPKVGKLGEAVGGLFAGREDARGENGREAEETDERPDEEDEQRGD